MDVLKTISTLRTSQSEKALPEQVRNEAGGFAFQVGDEDRVRRFIILGSEENFYTPAKQLTQANADAVMRMAVNTPARLVDIICEISTAGRAPKQDQGIFALAIAASLADEAGRRYALSKLSDVCRTASTLFMFNSYVRQFRHDGPALMKAFARWYTDKPVGKLAYQLVKYREREGWTHGDVLRKSHPVTADPVRRMALNWALGKGLNDYNQRAKGFTREQWAEMTSVERLEKKVATRASLVRTTDVPEELAIIADFEDAQAATTVPRWVEIVSRGHGLSWEMLPDAAQNEAAVWEALLHTDRGVPQTALIRQLGRLSRLGLCVGDTGRLICAQIVDERRLKLARVHPINLLVAQKTYTQGQGMRGHSEWPVINKVAVTLSDAFPVAYCAVEPADKRTLVAVDGSGSMWHYTISGMPLSACEAAGAIATVTGATEPEVTHVWFTTRTKRLDIGGRRLDDVLAHLRSMATPEGTDCAQPMLFATQNKIEVDTFIVLTDGQTWAGGIHPFQALEQYRQKMGINAKLVSVAMTATGTSIRRPDDAGTLDVVGFDTAVPQMAADFSGGRI